MTSAVGTRPRILVVDDSPEMRALVVGTLSDQYVTDSTEDGAGAIALARSMRPDVIVLDLSLPDTDGLQVCTAIRAFSDAYIIMLTGRASEVDRVVGLTMGADDYVTKPFAPAELQARVAALLRRPRAGSVSPTTQRSVGDLAIDLEAREVRVAGELLHLTRTEFELLDALSSRPRVALTRATLLTKVWGEWFGDDHVVDVHMANLRRKLRAASTGDPIATVRGVGYRLDV